MDFYSKPYKSIGGYTCKMWYHFSINILFNKEMHEKKFGYHNFYYDGLFHFFSIYPIRIDWCKRGIIVDAQEERDKKIKKLLK